MVNLIMAALLSASILIGMPSDYSPAVEKSRAITASRNIHTSRDAYPDMFRKIKQYNPRLTNIDILRIITAVNKASIKYGVRRNIIYAVIAAESGFDPKAKGSLDDMGLMQIRLKYAKGWAKNANIEFNGVQTLYDIEKNIDLGTYILSCLGKKYDNDIFMTLLAYNRGTGYLDRAVKSGESLPATYVKRVSNHHYRLFQNKLAYNG